MNTTDKAKIEEITRIYDAMAMALNEYKEDIDQTELKLGTTSKVVKKKRDQLKTFALMYDKSLGYINYLRALNQGMHNDLVAIHLVYTKLGTSLPMSALASMVNDDFEKWDTVDKIDDVINSVYDKLKLDKNTFAIQCLIETIKS